MKKLLMLGTSYASCAMVEYSKSIGVYTIVTDFELPEKSVAKLISDEYWMINTADIDALEAKCREYKIDGVMCGISEFNLEVALELCKRLGLKAYCTPQAWHYSRDKNDFKALCKKVGVSVAKDYYVSEDMRPEDLQKIEFPVVVKPVDMSGNRGISYCYNIDELKKAYKYARSVSKSNKIIVEKMLHGKEWYSMYAVVGGKARLLALNAMYAQPGEPKNCYTITTTVSDHVERFIKEINPKIEEVLAAVGCTDGIAWVQVMLDDDDKFYVIEMGYRMDGEMMFFPYRELLGFDAIAWFVETALGIEHDISQVPEPQKHAFVKTATGMELWTNKEGTVTKIEGFDEIAKLPGVYCETLKQVGDGIVKYRPVGVITFATNTYDEMERMIKLVNSQVHVYNEFNEDVIIKYTDFEYLRKIYETGLKESE